MVNDNGIPGGIPKVSRAGADCDSYAGGLWTLISYFESYFVRSMSYLLLAQTSLSTPLSKGTLAYLHNSVIKNINGNAVDVF